MRRNFSVLEGNTENTRDIDMVFVIISLHFVVKEGTNGRIL